MRDSQTVDLGKWGDDVCLCCVCSGGSDCVWLGCMACVGASVRAGVWGGAELYVWGSVGKCGVWGSVYR